MNANSKDVPTVKLLIDGAFVVRHERVARHRQPGDAAGARACAVRDRRGSRRRAGRAYAFATWKNTPIAARMRIS